MNIAAAIVIGTALIGGSVMWSSDRAGWDARSAGYLASDGGGTALSRLAELEIEAGGNSIPPDGTSWAVAYAGGVEHGRVPPRQSEVM
jgi:hypothetical protein